MAKKRSTLDSHFPVTFLTVSIVVTALVLLWLGYSSYRSYKVAVFSNKLSAQSSILKGTILYLDEVLTMSARMAVATGDLRWEKRYRYFEPQLDAAIKEAIRVAPEVNSGKAAEVTDAANIALINMENESFDLIRQGRMEEAKVILFSQEYLKQKDTYAQGIQTFTDILIASVNRSIDIQSKSVFFNLPSIFIVLIILIAGWFFVLRSVRRWEGMFKEIMANLDAKVLERTKELESAKSLALQGAQQARQAEEENRAIVETANDAFVSINESGNILRWNHKAEKTFGWLRQEVMGKELAGIIIPQEYQDAHRKGMAHYLKTKEGPVLGRTMELPALHRDGKVFFVEVTIWANRIQEKYQFNAFIRDISQRKEAEKQLRETFEELQKTHDELKQTQEQLLQSEKMASLGQLAAGVAHEINNPVGFISNNMEVLQEYIQGYTKVLRATEHIKKYIEEGDLEKSSLALGALHKLEEEINLEYMTNDVHKLLEQSNRGLERIKKIVMDLRTFAREDNVDNMELIKAEEVIDSILNIVQNELKYKAELSKEYTDTPLVKGNPQRLGQVFINLLVNASHAIEERGQITIRTYQQNGYVCVDIVDTGKGIPQENLRKIFDPFFTTKPVGQGTGLGLSVSYEIVKKLKGEITVKSTVGKGTVFTVHLPIVQS